MKDKDDDVIDGELDEGYRGARPVAPAPSRTAIARLPETLQREVDEAYLRAEEARQTAAEAMRAAEEAKEAAQQAADQANILAHQAHSIQLAAVHEAREALRPPVEAYEIEVTSIWDYSRTTKAIEFTVPGAPNFTRHGEHPPQLRAYVTTGYYASHPDELDFSAPRYHQLTSGVPEVKRLPRNRELDVFVEKSTVISSGLTEEKISEACQKVLSEHLDLVERERAWTGADTEDTPEARPTNESFAGKKFKVKA